MFWHLNPKKLNAFTVAHKQKLKEQDALMHLWFGTYGISALTFAIEHCLNGRKAKSEYTKDLVLSKVEENNKPLTEEEIQKQRELFVVQLRVKKANFDLNKKKENKESGDGTII